MSAPQPPQSPRTKRLRRWAVASAALSAAAFLLSIVFAGAVPAAPALIYPALHFIGLASGLNGYLLWQRSDPAYDYRQEPTAEE
jgi:archaellum biogenesis protein FlaJ (TadC family)